MIMTIMLVSFDEIKNTDLINVQIGTCIMSLNWRADNSKVGWFEFIISLLLFAGGISMVDFATVNNWRSLTFISFAIIICMIQCYLFFRRYKTLPQQAIQP